MRRSTSGVVSLLAVPALLAAACAGLVGDPGSSSLGGESGRGGSGAGSGGGGSSAGSGTGAPDPGRVTLHRLNRAEYNNTVRDLFGTSMTPADDFPADDHGYGFDNIADVLSVSPNLVELYERAAEKLVDEALAVPLPDPIAVQVEAETLTSTIGAPGANDWNLWSEGDLSHTFTVPSDGRYTISARCWSDPAGPDPARAQLAVLGTDLGTFDVPGDESASTLIQGEAVLKAGAAPVTVSFTNDFYDMAAGQDRNLHVDWIRIEGPLDAANPENPLRDRLYVCDPTAGGDGCIRTIIESFAERAWRRPLTGAEVDGLFGLVGVARAQGGTDDDGIRLAVQGALLSANFIFRVELDPTPLAPESHPLGAWELASRLSYFLWSSMPDDQLFAQAESGALLDLKVLEAEARRMLAHPNAVELVDNFAGQWLLTRAVDVHAPDYNDFPQFDDELRVALRTESRMFFQEFLDQGHPVEDMLLADFTYSNDRLAQHYGLGGSFDNSFERVTLTDEQRGGILRQAGVLMVTSYPTRTSPVKRGKWVLGSILCDEPKPPPPGVDADLPKEDLANKPLREVLALHRAKPECAPCHNVMDPIGLALENYDGIGEWRDVDATGATIDATGVMPDGTNIDGALDMATVVAADPRFGLCVLEKLFTYGLGRGAGVADEPYLASAAESIGGKAFSLEDAIVAIAKSEPFRTRRGEPEAKK